MDIVLDTNVLLVALPSRSKYHPIFEALQRKKYNLFITNEILAEYEEQIGFRIGVARTELHIYQLLNLTNVLKIQPYYFWQLIDIDKDDNKFVDCAIACNADYLVSNDRHYDILASIKFPNVEVIRAEEFLKIVAEFSA